MSNKYEQFDRKTTIDKTVWSFYSANSNTLSLVNYIVMNMRVKVCYLTFNWYQNFKLIQAWALEYNFRNKDQG